MLAHTANGRMARKPKRFGSIEDSRGLKERGGNEGRVGPWT